MRFFCLLFSLCLLLAAGPINVSYAAPQQSKKTTSAQSSGKKSSGKPKSGKKSSGGKKKSAPASKKKSSRKGTTAAPVLESYSDVADAAAESSGRGSANDTVSVSMRGHGPSFERTAQACLFAGNRCVLNNISVGEAAEELAYAAPTFITGGISLKNGDTPSRETLETWSEARAILQKANSRVGFDITVNAAEFSSPEQAQDFFRKAESLLPAEAWTLTGAETLYSRNPQLYAAVLEAAKAGGRRAGAVIEGASSLPLLDYALVPYGKGGSEFSGRLKAASASARVPGGKAKRIPALIVMGTDAFGRGFASGVTPAARRQMVAEAAKAQHLPSVSLAYPVFGPLASNDRAYNALRDEFMRDTISRAIKSGNPIARPLPLGNGGGRAGAEEYDGLD